MTVIPAVYTDGGISGQMTPLFPTGTYRSHCLVPTIKSSITCKKIIKKAVYTYIKRNNESVPMKGKELDLAASESNALFLIN